MAGGNMDYEDYQSCAKNIHRLLATVQCFELFDNKVLLHVCPSA